MLLSLIEVSLCLSDSATITVVHLSSNVSSLATRAAPIDQISSRLGTLVMVDLGLRGIALEVASPALAVLD